MFSLITVIKTQYKNNSRLDPLVIIFEVLGYTLHITDQNKSNIYFSDLF